MQNQALECSLQNVTASPKTDKQLKELEGTEVLIYVEEVNNSRFVNFANYKYRNKFFIFL